MGGGARTDNVAVASGGHDGGIAYAWRSSNLKDDVHLSEWGALALSGRGED